MERKIGEIFKYNGEWYQCVEEIGCNGCAFSTINCDEIDDIFGKCTIGLRHDDKSVIFKKLEKVGDPYEHCGKLYQCYKLPMEIEIGLLPNNCNPIGKDNLVEIEIKQNKEDMEEKKQKLGKLVDDYMTCRIQHAEFEKGIRELYEKHSNSESIGKNLKPFDLQKAKEGKPVCTRDGRKARIICFNRNDLYPIVALIECEDGKEIIGAYSKEGQTEIYEIKGTNLMMLPEKRTGWINVYNSLGVVTFSHNPYDTREEAIQAVAESPSDRKYYVDTIKISWEE